MYWGHIADDGSARCSVVAADACSLVQHLVHVAKDMADKSLALTLFRLGDWLLVEISRIQVVDSAEISKSGYPWLGIKQLRNG